MDIENVYKQLTNVDIEKQKQLWDDRGKGYYGKFLVFYELYKNISGKCKILMNLNIPVEDEKTTEIDLILIHETGLYVLEVKHYKGTIYGKNTDSTWPQYFRTTKNSTFKNPMLQNEYHIKALRNIFKNIPIQSMIVFTNNNCDIKVKNTNPDIKLCQLYNLDRTLETIFNSSKNILSIQEIDDAFDKLSKYSQMQDIVLYDGKKESFISWLQPTIQKLEQEKETLNTQILTNKKEKIRRTIINVVIIAVLILFSIIYTNQLKTNYKNELKNIQQNYDDKLNNISADYNNQLESLKQNFKHVEEINNEYIKNLNEYFSASDVAINRLSNDAVTFTAKIKRENDVYGMALTEKSKYIVMTTNNKVFEYDVFGKNLSYSRIANVLGKGIRDYGTLAQAQFYGVSKNEIEYIKLTNIELFKLDVARTIVKDNLELELYSK